MADVLQQLDALSWRGMHLPVTHLRVSVSQDLAEHKYWGVDGARVESTGRQPIRLTAEIPFYNGIVPGKTEKWGAPFPDMFDRFCGSMHDRTTGVLLHPVYGQLLCKPVGIEIEVAAERRDGATVTATWIETADEDFDFQGAAEPKARPEAELAALDLDASAEDIRSLVPKALKYEESFSSMMNKVTGIVDQVGIQSKRAVGQVDAIAYRANAFVDSVNRSRNAITWPLRDAAERMISASHTLADEITRTSGRTIARYVVLAETTLAGLMPLLPNAKLADVIKLNPSLMSSPSVPVGSIVRYYVPRTR